MASYTQRMIVRRSHGVLALAVTLALGACFEDSGDPTEPKQGNGRFVSDAAIEGDAAPRKIAPAMPPEDDPDGGSEGCSSDAQCSNGVACDGDERCVQRTCVPGTPPDCPPEHACSEAAGGCDCSKPDFDGDGYIAIKCGGGAEGDCDDSLADVHPGNVEICDPGGLQDDDCDWHTFGKLDADGDGEDSNQCCNKAPDGTLNCGHDCDDSRDDVNRDHGGQETCDGNDVDEDCDGYFDELAGTGVNGSLREPFYRDRDHDSFGDDSDTVLACMQPEGYASEPNDCADVIEHPFHQTDDPAYIHPGAREICDGYDDDCNHKIDADDPGLERPIIARTTLKCGGKDGWLIDTCEADYDDCNEDVHDGCETPIATLHDCRMCGRTCNFSCGSDDCDEITALASGDDNSCAITREGVAACWGSNGYGQIGDDSTPIALVPRKVGVLGPVERIAVGGAHVCATTRADGTLYCWGDNRHGQLGRFGAGDSSPVPIQTNGLLTSTLTGVGEIAAGRNHTCAIVGGSAMCWGQGDSGQVGDDMPGAHDADSPREVMRSHPQAPVHDAAAIVAGADHSCLITRDRTVECWGANNVGQLGRGDAGAIVSASTAALATGLSDVDRLAAGAYHTCALSGGKVYCWGENSHGQLGGSSTTSSGAARTSDDTPRQVPDLTGIVAIAAGRESTCALDGDGKLRCWGKSNYGELGTVSSQPSAPVLVSIDAVAEISMGLGHVCARLAAGPVQCWGRDASGQLGDEQSTNEAQPLPRKLHWLYGSTP